MKNKSHFENVTLETDWDLLSNSPLFDVEFYLQHNPDVEASGIDAISHYLSWGANEGRNPSENFDTASYLLKNLDVRLSRMNPLVHYLRFGKEEGRKATQASEASTLPEQEKFDSEEDKSIDSDSVDLGKKQSIYYAHQELLQQHEMFDAAYYLENNPDVAAAGIDPLAHFLEHGWREGRHPHPAFDMAWYLSEYPDVARDNIDPLIHYLRIGQSEGRKGRIDPRIFQIAERMILEAGNIEPTILLDNALSTTSRLAVSHSQNGGRALRAWQDFFVSLPKNYEYVVMVPWLTRGGADLAACNAVNASIQKHGVDSTLLLLTDYDRKDALDWLPNGTHIRVLSDYGPSLTFGERAFIIELFILTMQPRAVINVNSRALWDATVQKGGALTKATDIYACLFCRDFLPDGKAAGYADTHFRDGLPFLKKVYFDNEPFRQELIKDYGVPKSLQAKLQTVHQPVSAEALLKHGGGPVTRNAVVWAGRFCRQKNINLLLDIVQLAPALMFSVYGYGSDEYMEQMLRAAEKYKNLRLMGQFSSTMQLPLDDYNVFLYTSLWDGLPLVLADVAALGIPIVASAVGGIPDLVTVKTGWPIENYERAELYVKALNEVIQNPHMATKRSELMDEHVKTTHSWKQFSSTLSAFPSFLD